MSQKKIIVKLQGGLGNQLFQYSMGKAVALKLNINLVLDLSFYTIKDSYNRHFELNNFCIAKTNIINLNDYSFLEKYHNKIKNFIFKNKAVIYKEKEVFNRTKYFENLKRGFPVNAFTLLNIGKTTRVKLLGYWQSPLYFGNIRNILLKEFTLKNELPLNKNKELKLILETESVCIGVRQYNECKEAQVHYKLKLDYYEKAFKIIKSKINNPHYFIFTQDIEWSKKNIQPNEAITFIESSNEPCIDLELMKKCKHFIIPNSTYHWWGAWLSESHDKLVIAPKLGWANEKPVPDDWITI